MTAGERLPIIIVGVLSLCGCVATMIGAATVTTIDVAHDRRPLGAYIDDGAIEVKIKQYNLRNRDVRWQTHLSATSMNGVVPLTGEVQNSEIKNQVIEYIRGLDGVRRRPGRESV